MLWFKKLKEQTIIGPNTKVKGIINNSDELIISGCFEGEINIKGDVYIYEHGVVEAIINAGNVYIAGNVTGIINVSKKILIIEQGKYFYDPGILSKNIKTDKKNKTHTTNNIKHHPLLQLGYRK
jgi:cytoskeletal protein CcmA (bactofilin family)